MRHDAKASARYLYIACPRAPVGGGMFKVADYLIQAQSPVLEDGYAQLRLLDTRGGLNAVYSLWVVTTALARLVVGRLSGRLVGVHVNMAERLSVFRKGLVIIVARSLGLPVALHLHAAQLHQFYRRLPGPLQAAVRWVFSLASVCIVLGPAARRFVIQDLDVPAEKVELVINGVPEPSVARRRPEKGRVQRVLFLGNLMERKGVSDLLNALALPGFDRAHLVVDIAGGGDLETYRAKAKSLRIDDFVRFLGWVDQNKASHLLANADVLVLPSHDEGLPLVILEALANGVAVVCTPVGEVPTELSDGFDAYFVKPGDPESIAGGLQRILNDSTLRRSLELHGRARFEQRYSLNRFFDEIAKIHQTYLGVSSQPKRTAIELVVDK